MQERKYKSGPRGQEQFGLFRNMCFWSLLLLCLPFGVARAAPPDTVFLEDLTWTEVDALLKEGYSTVIIPTAGTEQNGPHIILGKHKYRINRGSELIARGLGRTLVAPVMTYVPEGRIDPPEGHMNYPGTISLPPLVFEQVLEYAARSLKQHGFRNILMIGDSGGNQAGMEKVASALTIEWEQSHARVHYISAWYGDGYEQFAAWLESLGFTSKQIGSHAGLSDTALMISVAPEHVRSERSVGKGFEIDGVDGDPTLATKELGDKGMEIMVDAALAQIRQLLQP